MADQVVNITNTDQEYRELLEWLNENVDEFWHNYRIPSSDDEDEVFGCRQSFTMRMNGA